MYFLTFQPEYMFNLCLYFNLCSYFNEAQSIKSRIYRISEKNDQRLVWCNSLTVISLNQGLLIAPKLRIHYSKTSQQWTRTESRQIVHYSLASTTDNVTDHVTYCWRMVQFFNSEYHCGKIVSTLKIILRIKLTINNKDNLNG